MVFVGSATKQPELVTCIEKHLRPGGTLFMQSDVLEVVEDMRIITRETAREYSVPTLLSVLLLLLLFLVAVSSSSSMEHATPPISWFKECAESTVASISRTGNAHRSAY